MDLKNNIRKTTPTSTGYVPEYPITWLVILTPGFYMAMTAWRGTAWVAIALG